MIKTSCNEFACPSEGSLVCASQVDAMIVLDGSGSLGEDGWDQMKQMGSMLFDALDKGNDTQVGTLLFSSRANQYWRFPLASDPSEPLCSPAYGTLGGEVSAVAEASLFDTVLHGATPKCFSCKGGSTTRCC